MSIELRANTQLFDAPSLKMYSIASGKGDAYGHTFGGPPRHEGVMPKGGSHPLHLLYLLNTDDPKVGWKIPGVKWLPLYHAFVYDGARLGYRVTSDREIDILHLNPLTVPQDWPYEDYPKAFRKTKARICDLPFDRKNIDHTVEFSGVFGFDWVPEHERLQTYKLLREQYPNYCDGPLSDTFEELSKQFSGPFLQGRPDSPCPNQSCANSDQPGKLAILAIVGNEPASRVYLWGKDNDGVELIFEICPLCKSIFVSNQCD